MTTIHFCFRLTADKLEQISEDQLPRSIRPSQPPIGQVLYQEQMPAPEGVEPENQVAAIAQEISAAAITGKSWLIATIEDYDTDATTFDELKEKAEAQLRKDPDLYARYQAGGGFQPGKSLKQWREVFGGDHGEWFDPMSPHKIPVSLEAWAGRDPERTHLAIKTRTYWHVFDA